MPLVTMGFCGSLGMAFLLHGHVGAAQHGLGFLAGDALGAQVDQHDVAFGAAADDAQAALGQRLGHRAFFTTCCW
jgi:hypothetical protein